MRYLNQNDYPYIKFMSNVDHCPDDDVEMVKRVYGGNIKISGCGMCSAVMAVHYLLPEAKFELWDAIDLNYECHANGTWGTEMENYGEPLAKKFNLDYKPSNSDEELIDCLKTGGVVIINVGGDQKDKGYTGVFSHGGHFILAISVERDGRIVILDPAFTEDRYDEEGRKGKVEVKYGKLCYTTIDVLREDSSNRDPGYFLFWRK